MSSILNSFFLTGIIANTSQNELAERFVSDSHYYLLKGNSNANFSRYDFTDFKENVPDNIVSLKIRQVSLVNSV